jgi:hypothetical protein
MVPSAIRVLDTLPRTAHGKIDRRALAAMPTRVDVRRDTRQASLNDLERQIVATWQDVLGIAEVGRHQNFFDIGGHSLLAAVVQQRLASRLGRSISVLEILRWPTVASLARHLGSSADEGTMLAGAIDRAERQRQAVSASRARHGARVRVPQDARRP